MQTQFEYIVNLAGRYKSYSNQPTALFDALHNLPPDIINDVYKQYGDTESKFQPVNVLRAEIARLLINATTITEPLIEEIKERIRKKDIAYFTHLSVEQQKQFADYVVPTRDMFAN